MISNNVQEEIKLEAMQRVWQNANRRLTSSVSVFEEVAEPEYCPLPRQSSCSAINLPKKFLAPKQSTFDDFEIYEEPQLEVKPTQSETPKYSILNAAEIGDLPAQYKICSVETYQYPVNGVYIDKRIIPGFKYRVRPLPSLAEPTKKHQCLFDNKALTLQSIGRGFARRFTFESEGNLSNDNYFYSDNRPEGYAFELEVVSENDKFTIFDMNDELQGTVEILKIEAPQVEIGNVILADRIEKKVKVKVTAKVEFYETGVAKLMPLSGIFISNKNKNEARAHISKVVHVNIKHHRYYLTPGILTTSRRVTVKGEDINDIPTKYTMTGIQPYEIPIVGTYIDPRIIPGFHYKVRPNDRKTHLFDGRALRLRSIGMGYAKRLTFEGDSMLNQDNFLWSDSHPDGLGLEPRGIHKGMKFRIVADGHKVGEALVFRADLPQVEERTEMVQTPSGKHAVVKYIHANTMCHITFDNNSGTLMGVYGLAVVRKEPNAKNAEVIRVENIAFDSQLILLFARNYRELIFEPLL